GHAAAARPGLAGAHLPSRRVRRTADAHRLRGHRAIHHPTWSRSSLRECHRKVSVIMRESGWDVLAQAAEMARRGEALALATVVWRQAPSSGKQGSRAIITASGEISGWIGGACAEPVVLREARQVITEGTPRLLLL